MRIFVEFIAMNFKEKSSETTLMILQYKQGIKVLAKRTIILELENSIFQIERYVRLNITRQCFDLSTDSIFVSHFTNR